MKNAFLISIPVVLIVSLTCSNGIKPEHPVNPQKSAQLESYDKTTPEEESSLTDSIQLINTCENDAFVSELRENTALDSNAYTLTIKFKNGQRKRICQLDLPPGKAQINYCINEYTVVGTPCGGPCYSQVFVFTDERKANEQFSYCQRIGNNPNLIAHIENEAFEDLIIHSFETGKELTVHIDDNDFWNYGQMDTLFMIKNNLVLKYTTEDKHQKKKVINLEKILFNGEWRSGN